jgi:hypothetical protein
MSFWARTTKWWRFAKQHPGQAVGVLIVGAIPLAILHLFQRQIAVWEDDFLDKYGTTWATSAVTVIVDFLAHHPVWSILLFALTVALGLLAHAYIATSPFNDFEKGTEAIASPHAPTSQPFASPVPIADTEPTLETLLDSSFPRHHKLWATPIVNFLDGRASGSVKLKSALYFDFLSNSTFLGFYIPASCMNVEVSHAIAEQCRVIAGEMADSGLKITATTPHEPPQHLTQLKFTGIVYLYHEDRLTHRQIADVEDVFKSNDLHVVLRGPDFLTAAWVDWKKRQDPSAAIPAQAAADARISEALAPGIEWEAQVQDMMRIFRNAYNEAEARHPGKNAKPTITPSPDDNIEIFMEALRRIKKEYGR